MSETNDSIAGDLFRKVIGVSDSERSELLSQVSPSVRAEVEQLLQFDVDAQKHGLLQSLQPSAEGHGRFIPGTEIGSRYRIVSLAGRGGMGEVYRADDLRIGESVALKFPSWDITSNQQHAKQFYAEVRLARQVTHPNVCQVYDVGEFEGQTFITMEYIDGEDLQSLVRRIGRLSHEKGVEIANEICAGLAAAHSKGVLHRDLKPANVMVDGKGHAHITDFGLALLAEKEPREGDGSGTPAYMAPEQLLRGETSVQSDLYSLGLILFETFTGQHAYPTESLKELVALHSAASGPVRPSDLIDEMDPAVDIAIRRCLESDPAERPKSAASVAAQLSSGDPLFTSQVTDEVPSPDLVATYGERGFLSPWIALCLVVFACVGLSALVIKSDTSRWLNVTALEPPQKLQHDARSLIQRFGYDTEQADWSSGFMGRERGTGGETDVAFWYRQSPQALIGIQIPLQARPANYGTIVNLSDPPWTVPGMIALSLGAAPQFSTSLSPRSLRQQPSSAAALKWFRAMPLNEKQSEPVDQRAFQGGANSVVWEDWFGEEVIGFDLRKLKSAAWRNTPPDAFDQHVAWEGDLADGPRVYVEAASFRGRPTYFRVMTQKEFGTTDSPPVELVQANIGTGVGLSVTNILTVLAIVVFARRNWRLRRCDRSGAAKVASVVLLGHMIAWFCLTTHTLHPSEYFLVRDGLKSAIGSAFTTWVVYLALEPFVRKHVPHLLVSWSRLLDGRWADPIVGRDVLIAAVVAIWVEVFLGLIQSLPSANPLGIQHIALAGWNGVAGSAIGGGAGFVTWMLILFTTCIAIYRYSRRRWVACAFIFLGIGLSAAARDENMHLFYLYLIVALLPAVVAIRFGLLFLVAFAILDDWLQQPITANSDAFYFPTSVFWVVFFGTLVILASLISLGNRRRTLFA